MRIEPVPRLRRERADVRLPHLLAFNVRDLPRERAARCQRCDLRPVFVPIVHVVRQGALAGALHCVRSDGLRTVP